MFEFLSNLSKLMMTALVAATPALAVETPQFEDGYEFFGRSANVNVMNTSEYQDSLRSMQSQLDAICPDTFCEGDYSNITSLGVDCSLNAITGAVGECVWTLAGSYTLVDASTGHLAVNKKIFECNFGIKGDSNDLAAFLKRAANPGTSGYDGLNVPLPGTHKTLMNVLSACL